MHPLSTTQDDAPAYGAVAVIDPPSEGWLHLPSLHQRLLPLAQAAGHEKLLLSAHFGDELPYYEADATGGPTGFRRYITFFDYGSTPSQFERALREKLTEQKGYTERHAA